MQAASTKKSKKARTGTMSSTLRCFKVLELLAEEPFELSVSDTAERLSMPRASVHRLCATLVEGGFVEPVPASKRYRLTPKSLWVGSGYLRHSAIYRAAFFPMQALSKQISATAQLGVLSVGKVLFIHSVGFPGPTEAFADVGLTRALHATAAGKLFLADMPLEEVKRLMARGVERYTERTAVSFEQIKEELLQIVEKGYAVNDEELLPGFFIMAAPIYDSAGSTVGTISVTLLADKAHQGDGQPPYVAQLLEAARKASLQFGYHPLSQVIQLKRSKPKSR
jgi:DNA-binding IclR family transcriptional regulator